MPLTKLVTLRGRRPKHRVRNVRMNRVPTTELVRMLATMSVPQVAREIGVSVSAVRHRLAHHRITIGEGRPDDGLTVRQRIREREGVRV
jgi:pyruvate/2-oxoglutarate dehydrogenase complex dihydrolipoamide acyltransferase (E2) component